MHLVVKSINFQIRYSGLSDGDVISTVSKILNVDANQSDMDTQKSVVNGFNSELSNLT